jgi:hypothetical protein
MRGSECHDIFTPTEDWMRFELVTFPDFQQTESACFPDYYGPTSCNMPLNKSNAIERICI